MTHATGEKYLKNGVMPHMWCSGCGIGVMVGALLRAFEELQYRHSELVVVTGIGCTGKVDDYLTTNALHTTHGRALPHATGIKAFNPRLQVVVIMGDGDAVTIGGNHFIHAARRNIDLTAIVVNNFNYGMTGGQVSGSTPGGASPVRPCTAIPSARSISVLWRRLPGQTTWPGGLLCTAGSCRSLSRRR